MSPRYSRIVLGYIPKRYYKLIRKKLEKIHKKNDNRYQTVVIELKDTNHVIRSYIYLFKIYKKLTKNSKVIFFSKNIPIIIYQTVSQSPFEERLLSFFKNKRISNSTFRKNSIYIKK